MLKKIASMHNRIFIFENVFLMKVHYITVYLMIFKINACQLKWAIVLMHDDGSKNILQKSHVFNRNTRVQKMVT